MRLSELVKVLLLAGAILAGPAASVRACMVTQTVYTVLPADLREILEQATSIRVSRHWWAAKSAKGTEQQRLTADISGPEKARLISALQTVPEERTRPGRREMVRLGFPEQPYRITATRDGKTAVLTICFECFDKEIAIAKINDMRIGLKGSAREVFEATLKSHGRPSGPVPADEVREIKQVQAAQRASEKAQQASATAPTRGPGGIFPQSGVPQPSGAAGCGNGAAGW